MHAPDLRLLPRPWTWLALALCACSGKDAEEGGPNATDPDEGRLVRVEWIAPDDGPPPPSKRVARHAVADGGGEALPEGWEVVQGAGQLEAHSLNDGSTVPGLSLRGRNPIVRLSGSFDPRTFNRVAVTLSISGPIDLGVVLGRDGKGMLRAPYLRSDGGGRKAGPTTVLVDVPGTLSADEPFDFLEVRFVRVLRDPVLIGIDLVHRPLAAWLPDPGAGESPVVVGTESRNAVALSDTSPLEAALVPFEGSSFCFAWGRPEAVYRRGVRTRLVVDIEDARDKSHRREIRLPRRADSGWEECEVDLEGLVAPVRVQISIESDDEDPGELWCAIASARVQRRGAWARTVVLVTSDTHRGDHLGGARDGVAVRTPFLDAFGASGVQFDACSSTTTITIPSHAALLTGLSPRDTRMVDNITSLSQEAATLAERFRAEGYLTQAFVSTRILRHGQSGLAQGFDRMDYPEDAQRRSEDTLAHFREAQPGLEGLPVFAWLHLFDAHSPYVPPDELTRTYYGDEGDPRDKSAHDPPPEAIPIWDSGLRDPAWVLAQYKAEVTWLDQNLGQALDAPRFNDAVIAITADHGESLGNHDVWYMHKGLYPDTTHVPLLLRWPDAPAGTRVTTPVTNADLGRTLLDLAGLGYVPFPGTTLLRHLDPERPAEPVFAMGSHAVAASVRLENWLCVLNLTDHQHPDRVAHQVELYDLSRDPACERDLVDAEHDRAARMRRLILDWLAAARTEVLSGATEGLTAGDHADLAALGYASESSAASNSASWYEPNPKSPWVQRFE